MTEEQKQQKSDADTFAATLGSLEGMTKPLDKWEARAEEGHKRAMETDTVHCRAMEHEIATRDNEIARADRYEEHHKIEWAHNAERHGLYLAELKHVQSHRERGVAAFERIANALEKLTGKENP